MPEAGEEEPPMAATATEEPLAASSNTEPAKEDPTGAGQADEVETAEAPSVETGGYEVGIDPEDDGESANEGSVNYGDEVVEDPYAKNEELDAEDADANAGTEGQAEAEGKTKALGDLEAETDEKPDDRQRVASHGVTFSDYDATLDVLVASEGTLISSLQQNGFQHLLSGSRATIGSKAGRYLFEVKVLEHTPNTRDFELRVGLSVAKSSVLVGFSNPSSVAFDSHSRFQEPTEKEPFKARGGIKLRPIFQDKVIGILVNLDAGSPNANTVSMFLDGVRAGAPQPIPAHLRGQALYPTVTFKNAVLQVNLGHSGCQLSPLPFKCRMFADMAIDDSEANSSCRPADGRYSVVVPVGLPEQGVFDFADWLVERLGYTELSDRAILNWARRSGVKETAQRQYGSSKDRPAFRFGLPTLDGRQTRPCLLSLARLAKRNFVVVEARANLIKRERETLLGHFSAGHFDVCAHVAVGEPTIEFKEWLHTRIRSSRKKIRALEKAKASIAKKRKLGSGSALESGQKLALKDEKEAELTVISSDGDEDAKPAPSGPDVWYTPREPGDDPDISEKLISVTYGDFSLPGEDEGFKKIEYAWLSQTAAEEHMRSWQKEMKVRTVLKDLKPSEWFKEKKNAWEKDLKEMQEKHKAFLVKRDAETSDKDLEVSLDEVDDIHNAKGDAPLYACFQKEDWFLLSWRYELHIMAHAFAHDVDDADRPGIPVVHISDYFQIYYQRELDHTRLGFTAVAAALTIVKDSITFEGKRMSEILASRYSPDEPLSQFVKLTEASRRDRARRMDAGDESALIQLRVKQSGITACKGKKKGDGKGATKGGSFISPKGRGKSAAIAHRFLPGSSRFGMLPQPRRFVVPLSPFPMTRPVAPRPPVPLFRFGARVGSAGSMTRMVRMPSPAERILRAANAGLKRPLIPPWNGGGPAKRPRVMPPAPAVATRAMTTWMSLAPRTHVSAPRPAGTDEERVS
jgi:hypothetical protein